MKFVNLSVSAYDLFDEDSLNLIDMVKDLHIDTAQADFAIREIMELELCTMYFDVVIKNGIIRKLWNINNLCQFYVANTYCSEVYSCI